MRQQLSWASGRVRVVLVAVIAVLVHACSGMPGESGSQQVTSGLTGFNVLTRAYNNQRTGVNPSESILNQSNVAPGTFGRVFQVAVDDEVYAGILYASGVSIANGTHDVFYVATVNNSVYAFDADVGGAPLWVRNYNGSGRPTRNTEVGQFCGTYTDFSGNIGIVSTPVIDASTQTMYFVARTVEAGATFQRLHAVDITTGAERSNSPQAIAGSLPGTGEGSNSGVLTFDPIIENQRTGLGLSGGVVYLGWASFCDTGSYHGWVMGYDATSLTQTGIANLSLNGAQSGVWMSGAAPAFDSAGNVYVSTGNGTFDGSTNFGESLVKLAPRTLSVLDSFTPSNFDALNAADEDFGSSGPVFLPGTNAVITAGKEGKAYLANSASMGHLGDNNALQVFQVVHPSARPSATHNLHNALVAWNGPSGLNLYGWGENDFAGSFRFTGSTFNTTALAVGSVLPPVGMPGGMISLSANGSQPGTGILWATTPRLGNANQSVVPGIFYAFNAENMALLWQSSSWSDDSASFAKFNPPLVADGKVYVASFSKVVSVYGLNPPQFQNLALNKPATGTSPCSSTQGAASAFNGSVTGGGDDKWCSHDPAPMLQVDLGATLQNVAHFVLRHAGAGGENPEYDTRDFNIQVSVDGTNFTTVTTVTGNASDVTIHDIATTPARFVRLNVVTATSNGDTAARIYEFEVYGTGGAGGGGGGGGGAGGASGSGGGGAGGGGAGGGGAGGGGAGGASGSGGVGSTNLALRKPATGSTPCSSDQGPDKAVNGSVSGGNTDKWCSHATGAALQVDLGAVFSVSQLVVKHAGAGGEFQGYDTRDFNFQVSLDGTNFSTVATVTGNSSNITTNNISPTSARFVRLNIVTPTSTGDTAARIYEFEVYGGADSGGSGGASGSGGTTASGGASGSGGTTASGGTTGSGGASGGGGTASGGASGSGGVGSTNLALRKPATGSTPCSSDQGPDKAVNGSVSGGNTDKWCSHATGAALQVDLGAVFSVSQLVVKHAGAGGEFQGYDTRDFNFQVSLDGTNFSTVATVTGNSSDITTNNIAPTSARFVRLNIVTPTSTGDTAARIYEFEVYGGADSGGGGGASGSGGTTASGGASGSGGTTASGGTTGSGGASGGGGTASGGASGSGGVGSTNLALRKPATGSTPCSSDQGPDKAVNGSVSGGNTDKWCSHATGAALQVDLGAVFSVSQLVVKHAGAGGEFQGYDTRDFNFQVSLDGTNFSTVATVTGNSSDITTNNIAPTSARFVRLNIVTPTSTGDTAARIYEFEVYGGADSSGGGGASGSGGTTASGGASGSGGTTASGGTSGGGGTASGGASGGGSVGSTNLALNKLATGSTPCSSTEGPPKAVNGSVSGGNSDKWCSQVAGASLQVDLGGVFNVAQFVVRHAGAGGEFPGLDTRDFNIQVSADGTNFSTVVIVMGNTADVTTHNIVTMGVRFIRLNIATPTSTGDSATRIYELEAYGPAN